MTDFNTEITELDIVAIRAQAEAMRAEAMRDMASAAGVWLKDLFNFSGVRQAS